MGCGVTDPTDRTCSADLGASPDFEGDATTVPLGPPLKFRDPSLKRRRLGFAAMSADTQQRIASLGGKAAHAKGTAHEFTQDEAREAGRKGGEASARRRAERAAKGGA